MDWLIDYGWLAFLIPVNAALIAFAQVRQMEKFSRGQSIRLPAGQRKFYDAALRRGVFVPRAGFSRADASGARFQRWMLLFPALAVRNLARAPVWLAFVAEVAIFFFILFTFTGRSPTG